MKYALSNGMINLDEVSKQINMNMIDKIKEAHSYAITPPSETRKDKRWQTYVLDETSPTGRRLLKTRTEEELYKRLSKIYSIFEDSDADTMNDVFKLWLPYKRSITNSENTIYRHTAHWRKYCEKMKICTKDMTDISRVELESWANELIKDNNMTKKEWQNVKVIIKGIWEFAYEKNIVNQNLWLSVKIWVKYKQVSKKSPETQVFVGNDFEKLISACHYMYDKTGNESYLAVEFNLYCGLRVGELVVIKKSDLDFENSCFAVEREEVCITIMNPDESLSYERKIEEHTKGYTSRYAPLIPQAADILKKIISKHESENIKTDYIFIKNNNHLNTHSVGRALLRACEKAGIPQKSTHKIRKTFASRLNANGVPIDEIRTLLGHADAQTTLGYIFNPLPKDETLDMIKNAF